MKRIFKVFQCEGAPHHAQVYDFDGVKNFHKVHYGRPFAEEYPSDFSGRMNPDSPQNTVLYDVIYNLSELLIISERLHTFMSEHVSDPVEYLPIQIVDHSGIEIPEKYWIVNALGSLDCLDAERSVVERSNIIPERIRRISRLVLDDSAIPEDRHLFKVSGIKSHIFSQELIDKMNAHEFTNIQWCEVGEFAWP